jgi:hypothetical protein
LPRSEIKAGFQGAGFNKQQKNNVMRKKVLKHIDKIRKTAEETNMQGQVTLEFTGCSVQEWDDVINSIIEYPRYKHFVQITPELTITLLLG